jgi:hypothetical protein
MTDKIKRPAVPGRPIQPAVTVTKILAFAPGTVSVTGNPAPGSGFQQLSSSASVIEPLDQNAPVIVLQGMANLLLEAVTSPPNQPATWSVKPNQNTASPPVIDPIVGGRKAVLKSDQPGSFSILAVGTTGAKPVVWNVVFVAVKITQGPKPATALGAAACRSIGGGGPLLIVQAGDPGNGKHGWSATVTATLTAGGANGDIGIDRVQLKMLQNGVADDITGSYLDRVAGLPKVLRAREVVAKLPVVDTDDDSGSDPARHFPSDSNANAVKISPSTGPTRTVSFFDSPATNAFKARHEHDSNALLASLDGQQKFRTAVAAISTMAPHSIVVYATIAWTVDVTGVVTTTVNQPLPGLVSTNWAAVPTSTGTTSDPSFTILAAPIDAASAGFEVWPPNFINQVHIRHDP